MFKWRSIENNPLIIPVTPSYLEGSQNVFKWRGHKICLNGEGTKYI